MDINYLHTQRLLLRPFCKQDVEAYFLLMHHPRVHCFVPDRLDEMKAADQAVEEKMSCNDGSDLAVCLKATNQFIGTVFGMWEKDTFSVCWNFLAEYGGKGYAYEAAKAYFDFLFYVKKARRIYAYVEEDNLHSKRLCEKLGMRQEGLFKEFVTFVDHEDGTPIYENTMQYAILKKEWVKE